MLVTSRLRPCTQRVDARSPDPTIPIEKTVEAMAQLVKYVVFLRLACCMLSEHHSQGGKNQVPRALRVLR